MQQGKVTGFSHVAFNVADMDRSLAFYCEALDIAKKFPGHPVVALAGKPGIAYLKIGNGAFLELFYPKPDTNLSSGGQQRQAGRIRSRNSSSLSDRPMRKRSSPSDKSRPVMRSMRSTR